MAGLVTITTLNLHSNIVGLDTEEDEEEEED